MKQVSFGRMARIAARWLCARIEIPALMLWGMAGLLTGFVGAAITFW
ncbi:MAG: hypothetical protein ACXU8U_05065 [Asticcacaulis sp.]